MSEVVHVNWLKIKATLIKLVIIIDHYPKYCYNIANITNTLKILQILKNKKLN